MKGRTNYNIYLRVIIIIRYLQTTKELKEEKNKEIKIHSYYKKKQQLSITFSSNSINYYNSENYYLRIVG